MNRETRFTTDVVSVNRLRAQTLVRIDTNTDMSVHGSSVDRDEHTSVTHSIVVV